jgi:hypothetical protein
VLEEEEHLVGVLPEAEDAEMQLEEEAFPEPELQHQPALPAAAQERVVDPEGRMPGQLPNAQEAILTDYAGQKRAMVEKVKGLLGTEGIVRAGGNQLMRWVVIEEHDPPPEDCFLIPLCPPHLV